MSIIDKKLDIFFNTGGDIRQLPFLPWFNSTRLINSFLSKLVLLHQKKGIISSKYCFTSGYALQLNEKGELVNDCYLPMVEPNDNYQNLTTGELLQLITKMKRENDCLFLSQCRVFYTTDKNKEISRGKGTKEVLEDFADFIHQSKFKCKLILFEYGPDIERTKEFCKTNKIEQHIFWLPKQPRKAIMNLLNEVDLVIESLMKNETSSSGSAFEAVLSNKPLLKNNNLDIIKSCKIEVYPYLQVETALDITQTLEDFTKTPYSYNKTVNEGRLWITEKLINKTITKINEVLNRESIHSSK